MNPDVSLRSYLASDKQIRTQRRYKEGYDYTFRGQPATSQR